MAEPAGNAGATNHAGSSSDAGSANTASGDAGSLGDAGAVSGPGGAMSGGGSPGASGAHPCTGVSGADGEQDPPALGCTTSYGCTGAQCAPVCPTPIGYEFVPAEPSVSLVGTSAWLPDGASSSLGVIEFRSSSDANASPFASLNGATLSGSFAGIADGAHLWLASKGAALPPFAADLVLPAVQLTTLPAGWSVVAGAAPQADAGAPTTNGSTFTWTSADADGFVELSWSSLFMPDMHGSVTSVFCRVAVSAHEFSPLLGAYGGGSASGSLRVVRLTHADAGASRVTLVAKRQLAKFP
ncbi:MAG: hypothetical protein ABI548_20745 [Polyangiaceae bacterium]